MQKYSNKYGTIIVMNKNCKNIVKLKLQVLEKYCNNYYTGITMKKYIIHNKYCKNRAANIIQKQLECERATKVCTGD